MDLAISISDRTYEELSGRKPGKSFSGTIKGIMHREITKGYPAVVPGYWGMFGDIDIDVAGLKRGNRGKTDISSRKGERTQMVILDTNAVIDALH